jgi:hypothetical protein
MKKESQKHDEVTAYFFERYEKASFRVVPGHWPDFKATKELLAYEHGISPEEITIKEEER